jgi:hypothetical protein
MSAAHPGDRVRGDASAPRQQSRPQVLLTLDRGKQQAGTSLRSLRNQGRAAVTVTVVRRDGGRAIRTRGPYAGWALRLPAPATGANPPRAAIRVRNAGTRDPLSPRARDFVFGADFRLDPRSSGDKDNGDNLVQRGHHNSSAQYKLQLDRGRILCRVKGAAGTVTVRGGRLVRQQWYRARCSRHAASLVLRVWRLRERGPRLAFVARAHGRSGAVGLARSVPLSVGGKLTPSGRIPAGGNDQFTGTVDRVVYGLRS